MSYVLPDVLAPNLQIVFCGTAASRISATRGYNYANPGNVFWPTLKKLGLIPPDFDPVNFRTLNHYGLGLTDLCKTCIGNDDELTPESYDTAALTQKLMQYQPRVLAFTSKQGASVYLQHKVAYGVQSECVGATQLYVLPSTSGRARRFFDEAAWQQLVTLYAKKSF